jgi:hypothetical protein
LGIREKVFIIVSDVQCVIVSEDPRAKHAHSAMLQNARQTA